MEKLSKTHYKIVLILLKYVPFIIGIIYFINAICQSLGIMLTIIPNLCFLSPLTAGIIAYLSYVFKNCIWHRLPIYYCLNVHCISVLDYYCDIPILDSYLLYVYLIVTILFILLGMYFKNRYNVRKWSKERTS